MSLKLAYTIAFKDKLNFYLTAFYVERIKCFF